MLIFSRFPWAFWIRLSERWSAADDAANDGVYE